MTRFSLLVVLLALIGVGSGVGCGGGDDSSQCEDVGNHMADCYDLSDEDRADIVSGCEQQIGQCADSDAAIDCILAIPCSEPDPQGASEDCVVQNCY